MRSQHCECNVIYIEHISRANKINPNQKSTIKSRDKEVTLRDHDEKKKKNYQILITIILLSQVVRNHTDCPSLFLLFFLPFACFTCISLLTQLDIL